MTNKEIDIILPQRDDSYEVVDSNTLGLSYEHLFLRGRARYYKREIFYKHVAFDKIADKIKNDNIIFITGNPLSGKTRVAYDTLFSIPNKKIVLPKTDSDIKEYKLPRDTKDLIIFIDEIDVFCTNVPIAINKLLFFCLNNDIKCVITCRTGPELSKVEKIINKDLYTELIVNRIEIPRFHKDEHKLKGLIEKNKLFFKNSDYFDGNIGSLILPMREMKLRYAYLSENDREVSTAILQGLKFHYHLFNYEHTKAHFDASKIKIFVEKYLGGNKISIIDWENGKKELLSTPKRMNFIEEDETCLIIEEAYLDFHKDQTLDVVDEDFTLLTIKRIFKELYKNPYEAAKLGFPTHINAWNKLIEKESSYEEANRIFNNIPVSLSPVRYTYELLLKKAIDKDTINRIYDIIKTKFNPNNSPNSTFVGKFNEFTELLETFASKNKQHLKFKTNVSERLIRLAKDSPQESIEYLFKKYPKDHIYSNYVFIKVCAVCLKSKQDFEKYVRPYLNKAPLLEQNLFKAFIRICIELGETEISLGFLEKNFTHDEYYYLNEKANCLKKSDPVSALGLYEQAIGISPNPRRIASTYNNYCQLVYDAKMIDKVDDAIEKCEIGIRDSKLSHAEFPYLRQILLLLTILKSNEADLIKNVQQLLMKQDVGKATIRKLISSVGDEQKKKLLMELF
jgi:hypothetical protein